MRKSLEKIIEMLQSERRSVVNAGLNRVKGLVEENVLGDFHDEVSDTLNRVRSYDSTRSDMIKVLTKVTEKLD